MAVIDKKNYIMYHCHTEYSLLDSCTNYQEYVNLAKENGQTALSISEHGKPLNWTEKWAACKEAGIKYMHSVEIYLTENLEPKVRDNYHTVLIAKNIEGVRELNKLIAKSCDAEHTYYVNRLTFEEFLNISSNIISTSACLASPLNKLPESNPYYSRLVDKYDFLEIQPHDHPEQIEFNKKLWELSKKTGKPLIAGTDTHSSSQYKADCRQILLTAKHKSYGDEDLFDLTYKTYDELVAAFRKQDALPEEVYLQAIDNTNLLDKMTEEIELDTSIKYPILYGTREADAEKFVETVNVLFEEKLSKGIIPREQEDAFREAIRNELEVFRKLQMDGFMLSMSELVRWCKEQGMAIGNARGSVGGSRIAYVTDIIDLNPETWHTVFSRFANEHRKEIGDIDIDCVEADRPKIFEYIINRFGKEKTARVASFGTIQEKGAIDDIGRALATLWDRENENHFQNPWSLDNIARIKKEYDTAPEQTKAHYPQLFRYFDGLVGTVVSQSVHPAGMVISPITLSDNYGTFLKDGEECLLLDMDNVHDYTGLAKYDFLILKTVQVIKETCDLIGCQYPKSHEVDWDDQAVWKDLTTNTKAIFQFEGDFAQSAIRKFKPKSIYEMSLVSACLRPTGESYRNSLLSRVPHRNPSAAIDNLLKNNLGYLVYQEDTIAFLQNICGLSGGEADEVRRAIGRKKVDVLEKALPSILEGYCSKSDKPREQAEEEAKEFLQVIEDSSGYQFGYNHSIAYCMLGYLCAYYRYYHPIEFITAFLNSAANDDDINNGSKLAAIKGITITRPKWGVSRSQYYFDKDKNLITRGLLSVKYMSASTAEDLYTLAHSKSYSSFMELLDDINNNTSLNSRQLDILIRTDFFDAFGNQRELLRIYDVWDSCLKKGTAKKIHREKIDGSVLEPVIRKYATGLTTNGAEAKFYTIMDMPAVEKEAENIIRSLNIEDFDDITKIKTAFELTGDHDFATGKPEDRRKLLILDDYDLRRGRARKKVGINVVTKSVGSGKESVFTVYNSVYNKLPIHKGDLITCKSYEKVNGYFNLLAYEKITPETVA